VEIVEEFANEAKVRLASFGHRSVSLRIGEGSRGWADHAPFDKILVTAAAREPPPALVEQLKVGGRMLIPLGEQDQVQHLSLVDKPSAQEVRTRAVMAVRFTQLETVEAPAPPTRSSDPDRRAGRFDM
jgi:protein-L-isoaspartate(D-aspartate) O-methyltransferase